MNFESIFKALKPGNFAFYLMQFASFDTWDLLSSRVFCYCCFASKWGNFLATVFEFVYILASLVFSRINRPEPSQTIIQNFPDKICIETKFWTFPTKDNGCPSVHSSIQQIQHWPPFPYCALIVISFTTKFRAETSGQLQSFSLALFSAFQFSF